MYKAKLLKMMNSPALTDIWKWSESSHLSLFVLCILNLIIAGGTLGITVATRGLIDGATGQNSMQIKRYAVVLVLIVLMIRGFSLIENDDEFMTTINKR